MNYKFYLLLLEVLIKITSVQNKNYCDLDQKCGNCEICGSDTNNYCSCSLNNIYCKNDGQNNYTFLPDFLYFFDGCLSNNGKLENICGNSNLDIDIGINKTINIKSSDYSHFFCFYNVKKINNNNNDINILIKKELNIPIFFNLYMIVYYNSDQIKVFSASNPLASSNYLELIELNTEKISVYIGVQDGQIIDKIKLNFGIKNGAIKTIKYTTKNSNKTNMKIIYGILIGVSALLVILLIICFILRKRNKKKNNNHNNHNNNNVSNTTIVNNNSKCTIIDSNKEKMDILFKNELIPTIYNKKNTINDCYNCTICIEEFIDGSSKIVTTKCKHSFHFKCFKNWVYKNIIFPRCPNCNSPILDKDNNNQNYLSGNQSSINTYNLQNNTTIGVNDIPY